MCSTWFEFELFMKTVNMTPKRDVKLYSTGQTRFVSLDDE